MLEIHCPERVLEAWALAEKLGKQESLQKGFDQFHRYMENRGNYEACDVHLYNDFAPYSFYFIVEVLVGGSWERDFNGGLIYHGAHDGGGDGGPPTFSVNITPHDGWAIHT
jgi:hypothetical protein